MTGNLDNTVFSERLKQTRKNAGLSQLELARLSGVSQGSIAHFECGRNQPKREILAKLCRVLHVDAEWLLPIFSENLPSPQHSSRGPVQGAATGSKSKEVPLALLSTLNALPPVQLAAITVFAEALNLGVIPNRTCLELTLDWQLLVDEKKALEDFVQ